MTTDFEHYPDAPALTEKGFPLIWIWYSFLTCSALGFAAFFYFSWVNEQHLAADTHWKSVEETREPILGLLKAGEHNNLLLPVFADGRQTELPDSLNLSEIKFDAAAGECYLVTVRRSGPKLWPVMISSDVKQVAHLSSMRDIR